MKMLSKHKFLPTKSLFIAAGIAACGLAASQQSVNALDLQLTSPGPNIYGYSLVFEDGDSFAIGDQLKITGVGGVTSTASNGFLDVFFDQGTFDSTSVTFTADQGFTAGGAQTQTGFTLISENDPGLVSWSLAGVSNLEPGPAAVPFEFSPGLGLLLSGTVFGALKLRSKFSRKEEINF